MTYCLGLTGSIGMGKSTTAQMFRDAGLPVWDADATVHQLYAKGGAAVAPIRAALPDAVIDDAVSRSVLKDMITADLGVLAIVEGIVHPLVAQDRQAFLARTTSDIAIFDIPLLFETRADTWLDATVVVSVPPEVQAERVLSRPDMTRAQFDAILSRQLPDDEKRARATHVIETLTLDGTRAAVDALIASIRKELTNA